MRVESWIHRVDEWVWGWTLLLLLLLVGVVFSIRTGFIQGRLGRALRYMVQREQGGVGETSSFGALCTALSASLGTGNIVGVATAITVGGPGALLWMLVAAVLGMATQYAEGVLAVRYRQRVDGCYLGGPFYYIEHGLGPGFRWLAVLFSLFGLLAGLFGVGTVVQANSMTEALSDFFDPLGMAVVFRFGGRTFTWPMVLGGAVVSILAAVVLGGGARRITALSQVLVPVMAGVFFVFSVSILVTHAARLPAAVSLMCRCALAPGAALGGAAGYTLKETMRLGISRGVFSNEAGLGTTPIAAAAARTHQPVRQGLVSMTGTFIDTVVLCTLTGLTILVTGAWEYADLEGAAVTAYAWQEGIPWLPPRVTAFLLMVCLVFFAFTSMVGWSYYAERCALYLVPRRWTPVVFRVAYVMAIAVGPYVYFSAAWELADIFNALMAFPNLLALLLLTPQVGEETARFFGRLETKKGKVQKAVDYFDGMDYNGKRKGKEVRKRWRNRQRFCGARGQKST